MAARIIIDTDIDTDCDDVGALAVAHALVSMGEAQLLGVVCSIPYAGTYRCVRAINRYYRRPEIPVGWLCDEDLDTSPRHGSYRAHLANADEYGFRRYNDTVAEEFGGPSADQEQPPEAVGLYRRLLSEQPDHSVTIIAVGFLTALQKLLASQPDDYSPLTGAQLVSAKVAQLVTMGQGSFPRGRDQFNWIMDTEAAAAVLGAWPGRLVVSEWGTNVHTGAGLASTSESNPVRRAYEVYLGGPRRSRSSWDQIAVLYGVRGPADLFEEVHSHHLTFDVRTGEHEWVRRKGESAGAKHVYLRQVASSERLEATIEELMAREF